MTTIREYRCNLCRDAINDTREGFGVHFTAWKPEVKGPGLSFKRVSECENHLCLACARSIHDELRKATPAQTAGGAT